MQTAPATVQQGQAQQFADLQSSYILGSGDKIRLIVYGEDQLSGEFTVDDAGQLSLPLVGAVSARGLSIPELPDRIKKRYQDG
ncbi:MAG: polysaccharide biosynthesis/export family protein [Sphingomonadales bacterium]